MRRDRCRHAGGLRFANPPYGYPQKNGGREASVSHSICVAALPEPACGVGEQGVDEAGLRGEVGAQGLRATLVAGDLVEQPLELGDVAVDRLLEAAVGAVRAGDLVERLLAGRRVEALGERLALAALVAVPHLGGEVAVHQPADVERQRLQRIGRTLAAAAL